MIYWAISAGVDKPKFVIFSIGYLQKSYKCVSKTNVYINIKAGFFLFISNIRVGTKFIKVVINTPLYMNCLRMKLLVFMQEWYILEEKKCQWQWLITLCVCTFLRPSLKKDYLLLVVMLIIITINCCGYMFLERH